MKGRRNEREIYITNWSWFTVDKKNEQYLSIIKRRIYFGI